MNTSEEQILDKSAAPLFKGYTLDEIRYKKAVAEIKIDIEKDRLMREVSGERREEEQAQGFLSMNRIFRYGQIAFFAYTFFKKAGLFMRGFKNKR